LGWREIGAVVKDVDDKTLLTLALVENIQRDALSPIDEALGYERLINEFNVSHAEVGELVGRDRSTIANALRLLRLPDDVQVRRADIVVAAVGVGRAPPNASTSRTRIAQRH